MATKVKKEVSGIKSALEIGAGIAAVTAAAYVLFGPEGKKNRKVIRGWAIKMKGEIIEKFEKAKDLTEPIYHKIVDEAQAKYAKFKNVDQEELAKVIADIKKHWKTIQKDTVGKKTKKIKK